MEVRPDARCRHIAFGADAAACRTVVPANHPTTQGYRAHWDAEANNCANFVCVVTRSTTAEFQHNDMMMRTNVQNDLRLEMALEMWIVCVHEKSEQL